MDAACADSYVVNDMMHPNDLPLVNFKTIVSNYLIRRYTKAEAEYYQIPIQNK